MATAVIVRLFERDEEQTEAVDKSTNTEMSATISIGDIQSDIQQPVLEMIELLPFVTSILKDSGTLEQWVEFFLSSLLLIRSVYYVPMD